MIFGQKKIKVVEKRNKVVNKDKVKDNFLIIDL